MLKEMYKVYCDGEIKWKDDETSTVARGVIVHFRLVVWDFPPDSE